MKTVIRHRIGRRQKKYWIIEFRSRGLRKEDVADAWTAEPHHAVTWCFDTRKEARNVAAELAAECDNLYLYRVRPARLSIHLLD